MPTYKKLIGFYIDPEERPVWTGEIINLATGELVKEPSMTKQSFKEECDINNIVKKFEATGQIDHINQAHAQGYYDDLPSGLDLQTALDTIRNAESAFMALPAATRAQFDNDPVKFTEAFTNPSESDVQRFADLGLVTLRKPEETPPAPPAALPEAPK